VTEGIDGFWVAVVAVVYGVPLAAVGWREFRQWQAGRR
jgi:hypothetical protein